MCIQRSIVTETYTLSAGEDRTIVVAAPTGLACIGGAWSQGGDNVHVYGMFPKTSPSESCEFRLHNTAAFSATIDIKGIFTVVI